MYRDRAEAGRVLAEGLLRYRDESPVVLALPRGGVPVAYEIAKRLSASLDVLVVRKLGAPEQPELAVGAVVETIGPDGPRPEVVLTSAARHPSIPTGFIESAAKRELQEIRRRQDAYRRGRTPPDIRGRTVILVDDGIATGATTRAALRAIRRQSPRRLVLAVPVAPPQTIQALRTEADEVFCPLTPLDFHAVGQFYQDFSQTTDEEVIELLDREAADAGRRCGSREEPGGTPPESKGPP